MQTHISYKNISAPQGEDWSFGSCRYSVDLSRASTIYGSSSKIQVKSAQLLIIIKA